MFDLHSGLGYSVVEFFLFLPFFIFFFLLFAAVDNKWQNSWTICNLLIARKNCIAKFGVAQRQLGELCGRSARGPELRQKSQEPDSLGTVTKLAFCWEGQLKGNLFALLLLHQVPTIVVLSSSHIHQLIVSCQLLVGIPSLNRLTIFLDQYNNNPVFSHLISPFSKTSKWANKWENLAKTKEPLNHFVQTLMAIFLPACPLCSVWYLGAWHVCLFHLKSSNHSSLWPNAA